MSDRCHQCNSENLACLDCQYGSLADEPQAVERAAKRAHELAHPDALNKWDDTDDNHVKDLYRLDAVAVLRAAEGEQT